MDIDSQTFRETLGRFCSGVVVVTAATEEEQMGFVVQSFMSLSLDPPLIALAPGKAGQTWPRIRELGRFCVNVLAADQLDLCRTFSNPCEDRFDGVTYTLGVTGSPILDGIIAYIDCDLHAEHDGGDHTLAVGHVRDLSVRGEDRAPLLFYGGAFGGFSGS